MFAILVAVVSQFASARTHMKDGVPNPPPHPPASMPTPTSTHAFSYAADAHPHAYGHTPAHTHTHGRSYTHTHTETEAYERGLNVSNWSNPYLPSPRSIEPKSMQTYRQGCCPTNLNPNPNIQPHTCSLGGRVEHAQMQTHSHHTRGWGEAVGCNLYWEC